jgi:hypothetical protein
MFAASVTQKSDGPSFNGMAPLGKESAATPTASARRMTSRFIDGDGVHSNKKAESHQARAYESAIISSRAL